MKSEKPGLAEWWQVFNDPYLDSLIESGHTSCGEPGYIPPGLAGAGSRKKD